MNMCGVWGTGLGTGPPSFPEENIVSSVGHCDSLMMWSQLSVLISPWPRLSRSPALGSLCTGTSPLILPFPSLGQRSWGWLDTRAQRHLFPGMKVTTRHRASQGNQVEAVSPFRTQTWRS